MSLSIIIPARNGHDFTSNCLQTILYSITALQLHGIQFVLIDDNSPEGDGIGALFRNFRRSATAHRVKIIRASHRLHYSTVFAVGLHFTEGDNVFFLSNDMSVTPHFLIAILGVAALSNDFGIVRGTSNWADSHPEYTIVPPEPISTYQDVATFSASRFSKLGFDHSEDRLLSGDAVLIKRQVINKIGVFDTRFFGYFGDLDYGMRAHLAGFKLVCAKGAWLHHQGSGYIKVEAQRGAPREKLDEERDRLVNSGYEIFQRKWGSLLPKAPIQANDFNQFSEAQRSAVSELKQEMPLSILSKLIIDE
jgi:GT2 family glycosyltransferase